MDLILVDGDAHAGATFQSDQAVPMVRERLQDIDVNVRERLRRLE